MVQIGSGQLRANFSVKTGASLTGLSIDGRDVLRPAPEVSDNPLEMGSFPLVPYANRIAHGHFTVQNKTFQLPLNFGDHPHSIHGVGWTAPWDVAESGDDSLTLIHAHAADDAWPWAYQAVQRAQANDTALDLSLTVRNLSDEPMPCGLGFHPYFLATAQSRLTFASTGVWLSTPDMLPSELVAAETLGDWGQGAPVPGTSLVDNCYVGWDGRALIDQGDRRIALTATGAPFLHVYRPPGEPFFCVEPVSHMPDAINRPEGMDMLAPGAEQVLTMRIALDA